MPAKAAPVAPATWKVVLAFACIYLIWGSTYLAIHIAIVSIPSYLMAGIRFVIAGTLMFALARASGAPMPKRVEWRTGFIIGGLLLLGGNGGVSFAEQRLPTGLAALLIATVPMWMAVIEWLRPGGTRPGGRAIVGLAIGFVGMIILVGPDKILAGKGSDPLSLGVLLLASILWASGSIYSRTRHARLPDQPLMATAVEMLGGAVCLMVMAALIGDFARFKPLAVSTSSILAVGYLVIFGSIVAFTAYGWLLKVSTPARVSTYAYVNPLVAVALGALLLGEALTPEMLVATPMILLAVILITTSRAQPAPQSDAPLMDEIPIGRQASMGVEK